MKGSLRFGSAGLYFAGAGLLALVAALSVVGFLHAAVPAAGVLAATRDLPPGAVIGAGDVTVRRLPAGAVPDGAVRAAGDVVGRRLRFGLVSGDYVRNQHLVPDGNSDVASALTKLGDEYRAIMLPADLVPAMEHLSAGDRLELTGILPVQDPHSNTTVTVPLGTALVVDVGAGSGRSSSGKSAVLVAMKASEVSQLALVMRAGSITIAVVGTGENIKPAPSVRLESLTGNATAAQPAGQPSGKPAGQAATPGAQSHP